MGITTQYVDLESILQHFVGDDPSRVKQAIVYACINKGARYVMLSWRCESFPGEA